MLNPGVPKCDEDLITLEIYVEQGNSVTRDLPSTGSEASTTILFIHIGYRFQMSLSTIWLGKPPSI